MTSTAEQYPLIGRIAVRAAVDDRSTPPPDPQLEAVAHVVCVMGGHIPHRDNESTGSCPFHRKIAAVALKQAHLASGSAR